MDTRPMTITSCMSCEFGNRSSEQFERSAQWWNHAQPIPEWPLHAKELCQLNVQNILRQQQSSALGSVRGLHIQRKQLQGFQSRHRGIPGTSHSIPYHPSSQLQTCVPFWASSQVPWIQGPWPSHPACLWSLDNETAVTSQKLDT